MVDSFGFHIPLIFTRLIVFCLILAPNLIADGAQADFKASCRIEIDNAHISTSIMRKSQTRAVKVDARSICNKYQIRVSLTVQIYKVGLFRDHFVRGTTTNPLSRNSSGFIAENNETAGTCLNNRSSRYYGVAFATATIEGQSLVAQRTRSQKIITLACGS